MDGRKGAWLWTIAPWLETLRSQMTFAVEHADEERLSEALCGYAEAACTSLRLALDSGLVLDVHPSNFGVVGGRCYYIDDDIAQGSRPASIGHALLRRADEYGEQVGAVDAYGRQLEVSFLEFTSVELSTLGLREALIETLVRSDAARALRERLIERLHTPTLLASSAK
jgi:hypothetical protein